MLEKSLLSKIFEHLTTRSNVFAVYMTVGYFEVKDDTQKPEFLGDEIGVLRDTTGAVVENKAVRHRMFAIIDRTNLTLQPPTFNVAAGVMETQDSQKREDQLRQGPAPYYYTSQCVQVGNRWRIVVPISSSFPSPTTAVPQLYVQTATGTYNGISWEINPALFPSGLSPTSGALMTSRPATVLYVGTGSEQRRLVVMTVKNLGTGYAEVDLGLAPLGMTPPIFANWLNIGQPPVAPALITNAIAGNPGPQPDFDHKQPNYRGVVLYSVIMD